MTQAADRRPRLLRADGGQTSLRVLRQVLLADHRLARQPGESGGLHLQGGQAQGIGRHHPGARRQGLQALHQV